MQNYYDVLMVRSEASPEEIKANYRKLSKKYHPDLNRGDKSAEDKFKEITEAYSILSNPGLRSEYDPKWGMASQPHKPKEASPKEANFRTAGDFDPQSVRGQFEQYFGFDPKTGTKRTSFFGEKQTESNPLDTSDVFEGFFRPKKK